MRREEENCVMSKTAAEREQREKVSASRKGLKHRSLVSPDDLVVVLDVGLPRQIAQSFQSLEILTDPCEEENSIRKLQTIHDSGLRDDILSIEKSKFSTSSCFRYNLTRSFWHGIHVPRPRIIAEASLRECNARSSAINRHACRVFSSESLPTATNCRECRECRECRVADAIDDSEQ